MGVFFGLEQQRVHPHFGLRPRSQRLKILRATDFPADNDTGVVAHILRFERRDLEALARVVAAQGGGQSAFASAAGGAQHHDAFGGHCALATGVAILIDGDTTINWVSALPNAASRRKSSKVLNVFIVLSGIAGTVLLVRCVGRDT